MKRYLFLSLLILSAMTSYAYDAYVGGIYYNLVPKAKGAKVTYGEGYSGAVSIPASFEYEGVTYNVIGIDNQAFYTCSSLTSVTIPNSVLSIGDHAFHGCTSLETITIPNSVTNIGSNFAADCSALTSIVIPNSITYISDYAFGGCSSLTTIDIPSSVTSIGDHVFSGCSSLQTITIPNSVTSIGNGTFSGCTSLTSVAISNSVRTIGWWLFQGCTSLSVVNIPNSVEDIGCYAFYGCVNLTDLTLGSSVSTIQSEAFKNCEKLENVYCYNVDVTSTSPDAFDGSFTEYATLYVPAESLSDYRATTPWSNFGTILPLTSPTPEDIDLVDGVEYANKIERTCNTLTYTRSFSNTDWQALYVPFGMNYADWSADFEIARLNDVHQFDDDEDGDVDRTVLESIKLKAGSSVEPNTPYLIKAKTTGTKKISLTNTTLYGAKENSFDVTSWNTRFNFTGTYHEVTNMASAGHYAMSDGGLKQATSDAATLCAYRWYLDITDRYGSPVPAMACAPIYIVFDDGEATAVENINVNPANDGNVYTVSGVKVVGDVNNLPKGIYIKNGKKVFVK